MRRFLLPGLAAVVACALLALLAFGVASQGTNSSIDAQLARGRHPVPPDANMALPILGSPGSESLASLRGKVVLVNVFASWCPPCQTEAPLLESEQRYLAHHDATILGVTYLDNTDDSESFVHTYHLTFPVVRDVNGTFTRAFGVDGVPESFVIDRQGRIAAVRRLQLSSAWLEQTLAPIVARAS